VEGGRLFVADVIESVKVVEALAPAAEIPVASVSAEPVAVGAERIIGRTLRVGALLSGSLFLLSLGLQTISASPSLAVDADGLRRAGASVLVVTPVVRLVVSGLALGRRGEWRYALCAAGVLSLLALAVAAGSHA
jgi:uncharacterized membrane protein